MLELNKIYQGDCLELMKDVPDKSVDMILCDLPYGTTACKWDIIIPFDKLWEQYKRLIKDNGAIVLFGSQPFTSLLINSNLKMFKYEIIWNKNKCGSPGLAKYRFMKTHENILIFSKGVEEYNPQMEEDEPYFRKRSGKTRENNMGYGFANSTKDIINKGTRYPKSIINISRDFSAQQQIHPTQKPVALCEYLIKTYTNEGDLVLDNCIGSGTTAIACVNTKRNFIGIEKEPKYVEIANERIAKAKEHKIELNSHLKKDNSEGSNTDYLETQSTTEEVNKQECKSESVDNQDDTLRGSEDGEK
jgi:site-specific DNA-methyltransferase (adenine-specific)